MKELKYRDRRTEEILSQASVASIHKDLCADKGASLEGDRKARDAAGKAVIEFLNKVLKS